MTTAAMLGPPTGGILLASADRSLRPRFLRNFEDRRSPVQQVFGGAEALVKLEAGGWEVVFLDRGLPDLAVEELEQIIRQRFPGVDVVVLEPEVQPATAALARGSSHPRGASGLNHPLRFRPTARLVPICCRTSRRTSQLRKPQSFPCQE